MSGVKPTGVPPEWTSAIKMPEGTKGRTSKTVQAMQALLKQEQQKLDAEQVVSVRSGIENIKARVVRHAKGTGLFKIFFGALMGWRAGSKFNTVLSTLEQEKKKTDSFKDLVDKCGKVEAHNWDNLCQEAIKQDNGEAFEILVNWKRGKGIDLFDASDYAKMTAVKENLELAAIYGSLGIVKKILKKQKGDVQPFVDAMGVAAEKGHVEVVRAFLKAGVPVNGANTKKETALEKAAMSGEYEVVHVLLEAGASIAPLQANHALLLWVAALTGRVESVRALLEKNAPVNAFNSRGDTALHMAVLGGHTEIVKALVAKGAKVDKKNRDGETALHMAVRKGHTEIVKALVASKEHVDVLNGDDETALSLAVLGGHTKIVRALLDADADTGMFVYGRTLLAIAIEKGYTDIANQLRKKEASETP